MFWFDKDNPDTIFTDIREETHKLCDGRIFEVKPDMIADFKKLPFNDNSFKLVVFDPPHLNWAGQKSWMGIKYGRLDKDSWKEDLTAGFNECWRVLARAGTLIFKWNETQIQLSELKDCFPDTPLFGHTTTRNLKTHWIVFFKSK